MTTTVHITPPAGYDGFSQVTAQTMQLQDKTVTASDSDITVTPDLDDGYAGLNSVTVHPSPTQTLEAATTAEQQVFTPASGYAGFSEVAVDAVPVTTATTVPTMVEQTLSPPDGYAGFTSVTVEAIDAQDKTVTPQETVVTVTADEGYSCLGTVTVNKPYADLTWVMEAKVGDHPVITAVDIRKVLPYIEADYGFAGMLGYAPITSVDLSEVDEVGAWSLATTFANNNTLTTVSMPALTTVNKERALYYAFANDTALTSVSFPALETITASYGCYQLFYNDTALTSVSFPALETVSGSYALSQMLQGCTALTSVSFPSLETLNANYGMYQMLKGCTHITSVSFSSLTELKGTNVIRELCNGVTTLTSIDFSNLEVIGIGTSATGNYAEYCVLSAFKGTSITEAIFPKLQRIYGGTFVAESMFENCHSLTRVEMPMLISSPFRQDYMFRNCENLAYVDLSSYTITGNSNFGASMWSGCTSLKRVKIHPNALSNTNSTNLSIIGTASPYIEIIEFSTNTNTNINLRTYSKINAEGVKNVLTAANNANMNGKSIYFYSSGLVITDEPDGSIATLKASVVARGCTVNNLTINPYTP